MAMANESDVQQLIAEGTGALRRGDKAAARTLLTRALEHDDRNEQVWLWLSGAVDTPEEQRICLENVLVLNPGSDIARRGLALLDQQHPPAPPAPPPMTPLPASAAATAPAPPPPPEPSPVWNAAPAAPTVEPPAAPAWPSALPAPPEVNAAWPPTWAATAPAASPAAPAWPPADGSIFGSAATVSDDVLPNWMDNPGGEVAAAPPPPAAPASSLPSSGSIFGSAPEPVDSVLPGWMDQPAGAYAPPAPPAPMPAATPEPPAPPMVGGAAANWANVVTSLRGNDAFQAPPAAEPEPEPQPFGGYTAPDTNAAWATAAPAPAAWPPGPSAAPDPALSGIQPFQVPTEIGSAPPPASDPFGGLFSGPPAAAPPSYPGYPDQSGGYEAQGGGYAAQSGGYPAPGSEAMQGYEGYGAAPAPTGYDPNAYAGADPNYQMPASADSFQFGTTDPYGSGEYTSPDGPGLLANLAGYDLSGHNYGSSPSLIGRPPLSRTPVTPTIPCPNCGELVTESALSCPRCNYRFYAPCPNCGEYVDTGDPSPTGKDVCPRCATPVDKLALGRAGVRMAGRGTNPREVMLAATRAQKTQKETTAAAPTDAKPRRRSSGAAFLLLIIILLVVGLLAAYQLDIQPISTILHSVLPAAATATPAP